MRKIKMFMIARHCEKSARLRGNPLNLSRVLFYGLPRSLCSLAMTSKAAFAVLALVLFLAPNSAKAEQSGWFVGVQAGYSQAKAQSKIDAQKTEYSSATKFTSAFSSIITKQTYVNGNWSDSGQSYTFNPADANNWRAARGARANSINRYVPGCPNDPNNCLYREKMTGDTTGANYPDFIEFSQDLHGFNAGFLAGYKHFFSKNLGVRFYGLFDFSFYSSDESPIVDKMQAYNTNLNVDILYNFYDKESKYIGVFAGASVGGAHYMSSGTNLATDIDLGLNFGFRFGLNKHHSIEFFSRVGGLFVGAENYRTNDRDYYQESFGSVSETTTKTETIRVCPANEASCLSTSSSNTGYNNQRTERWTATRTDTTTKYTQARTYQATSGLGIRADSYKQPYKIGLRYIYSF